ncbi:hypothetical protein D5Q71_22555 [Escherichia coli]|nr:hypothetical protein [Escherichia coli]
MGEAEKLTHQILNGENDHSASCVHFPETGKPVFGRRCDHVRHTCSVETVIPHSGVAGGYDADAGISVSVYP